MSCSATPPKTASSSWIAARPSMEHSEIAAFATVK